MSDLLVNTNHQAIKELNMQYDTLRRRFFNTAIGDILRALNGKSLVGATTLSLCAIDYLSFLKGGVDGIGSRYRKIVDEFLIKTINQRYDANQIYALRCALVHTYSESDAMARCVPPLKGYLLSHDNPLFHLSGEDSVLRINVDTFVADVIWASHLFFESNQKKHNAILKRAENLFIIKHSNLEAYIPYETMHTSLNEFDNPTPQYAKLSTSINSLVKRKNRRKKSTQTVINALDHLAYEVWMFESVIVAMSSNITGNGILNNAIIESFAMHIRNIIQFFYKDNPQPSDVVAADCFSDPSTWDNICPQITVNLQKAKSRAHKEIAHLTYDRIKVTPEKKPWPYQEIYKDLVYLLQIFLNSVPSNLLSDHWKSIRLYDYYSSF